MNPSQQLVTKSSNISELMKSTYFEVPSNQREYRWGKDQTQKLWEDLLVAVKNDEPGADAIGHFLGAIVVIGQEQSHDNSRWEIIDGQQRLTTITILSECLRGYLEEITDKKLRKKLEHVLLDCVVAPHADYVPRLKLNRENDFYANSLFENESKDEKIEYWAQAFDKQSEVQSNIKGAFEYFYSAIDSVLAGLDADDREVLIRSLAEALTDSFYVLVVRTAKLSLAYRLFETLNERGLDLSQADLIKNVLLQYAKISGGGAVDKVTSLWAKFIDNYEDQSPKKLDLPQLIQFSFTYRHSRVKKEMIFEEVSKKLGVDSYQAVDLASELTNDAASWRSFLLSDLQGWDDELSDMQYAIVDPLWKSHCASFIIASMDRFDSDIASLKKCLYLTESYLFRQGFIGKDSVGSMQEFFSEAAAMLRAEVPIIDIAKYFSKKSSDDLFKENFAKATVSNVRQAFYTIWKIENHLGQCTKIRPRNDTASQCVDYIMPRKPNSEWNGIENTEEYGGYLNRIGNILILPPKYTQSVRNESFEFKCENNTELDYLHSELKLPLAVAKNTNSWLEDGEWVFGSIVKRQKYLAEKYVLDVWGFNVG